MKRYFSAILMVVLLLFIPACDQTDTGTQTQSSESVADTVHTEATSVVTMEPMETEAAAIETVPVTEPSAETEPVTPPVGYGSEVTAFNSIREMIEKIKGGDLSAGAQKIFDAYGCDTEQLRELTGLDEGFSESMVEWCGGFNYCINYIKDGQVIAFKPYYTDELYIGALSELETWDVLQKNKLLLNLEKTDIPTDEGIMYECTFDTSRVTGQRKTYHGFTGADGIQRVVTNWYGADGNPISGQIFVFDDTLRFSCYVFGFEADMELAKRLGTKHVLSDNNTAENPVLLELHSQNEDQDFGFTVRMVDGVFEKSKRLTLDVTMTNQMDTAYTWTGSSSSFFPWMEFVCVTENGDFVIQPEPIPLTDDVANNSVAPGEHKTRRLSFQIPQDAPDGAYSLICSFQSTQYSFDGVFRLGEIQEDIVIGTVVYGETIPQNEIATDIHSERDVIDCKYYYVNSFWRDVGSKTVRGSVAVKMKQFLSACTETGQSAAALTDSADTYIDVDSRNLPCENDMEWYEADGVIYRYDRAEKTLARVNGHLGAGEYLHFDEQLLKEINHDIGYWPYNYFTGTYQNGVLTVNHKYRAATSASIEITGIQIDRIEGVDNSVTLAVTADADMTLTISLSSEFSDDNLLDVYRKSVTLQGGSTQTVVLPFLGSADHRYFLSIKTDSTVISMTILPQ